MIDQVSLGNLSHRAIDIYGLTPRVKCTFRYAQ